MSMKHFIVIICHFIFQGAVEVLNMVTKERDKVGQWKYKAEYQSQLTKAACIQLNGEVQYCLGNWYRSADLLLQSIELFATLPRPDKKVVGNKQCYLRAYMLMLFNLRANIDKILLWDPHACHTHSGSRR